MESTRWSRWSLDAVGLGDPLRALEDARHDELLMPFRRGGADRPALEAIVVFNLSDDMCQVALLNGEGNLVARNLDRRGSDWCGMRGSSWRLALVETKRLPLRVTADRRLGGAMCGNSLAWVRAESFSDGKHAEAAFMLWATPSIGATTYIYRIGGEHLQLLAKFEETR